MKTDISEENEIVIKSYNEGLSYREISKLIGKSSSYVYYRIKNLNLIKEYRKPFDKDEYNHKVETICNLYNSGKTIKEISLITNLRVNYVYKILRKTKCVEKRNIDINEMAVKPYQNGKTVEEICANVKLSKARLVEILKKENVYKYNKHYSHKNSIVISLYNDGKTIQDISKELNLSIQWIKKILNQNNIYSYKRFIRKPENIIEMYNNGKTVEEISEIFKLDIEQINKILK